VGEWSKVGVDYGSVWSCGVRVRYGMVEWYERGVGV